METENKQTEVSTKQKGSALPWVLVVILLLLLIISVSSTFYLLGQVEALKTKNENQVILEKTEIGITPSPTPTPTLQLKKEVKEINKEYSFPIYGADDTPITDIKLTLTEYELMDEIIVKGQRATAIEGRTFLIINLKVTNDLDREIEIDTRNYFRLSVNKEDEWSAPDIHNDPVSVLANSTEMTRFGFPINDTDEDYRLQIGEVNEIKETIDL